MTKRPKPSTIIFAKDIARLAQFYQSIAEMSPVHSDEDHIVLDDSGFQLVIHSIPKPIAATITITEPPLLRENMPIKFCLPIVSIATARQTAAALGGQIGPKAKEWEARGFRACDGYDPEGNIFQVRERVIE